MSLPSKVARTVRGFFPGAAINGVAPRKERFGIRHLAVCATLLYPSQAAVVSGTVYLRIDHTRTPARGVRISVRASEGAEVLRSAETDAAGRYALAELPKTKIRLAASKRGYVTSAVAGGDSNLLLDLAADETLAQQDFDLVPGGVITGRIAGALDEPLQGVRVEARPARGSVGLTLPPIGAVTDDRGVYRIFGLEPGSYVLLARPSAYQTDRRSAPLYYPGAADVSGAKPVAVASASEAAGIDFSFAGDSTCKMAGKVAGATPQQLARIHLRAEAEGAGAAGEPEFARVDSQGRFVFTGLPPGVYIVSAFERPEPGGREKLAARQRVDLRSDIENVVLNLGRAGSLSGTMKLVLEGRAQPDAGQFHVRLSDAGGRLAVEVPAKGPGYSFEFANLWPGLYRLDLTGPAGSYLRKITGQDGAAGGATVAISEGADTAVELEAAFGLGRASGIVKAPGGARVAHAQVALARLGGSTPEVLSTQTDQRGRWELKDIRPGEYSISAWAFLNREALFAPETWGAAGRVARRFVVDPGADVEIELTVAGWAAEEAP